MKLGALLNPLEQLTRHPERFDAHQRARIFGSFFHDVEPLRIAVDTFCREEPGFSYQIQYNKYYYAINGLFHSIREAPDDMDRIRSHLQSQGAVARDALLEIPVDGACGILDANSPFTAYCRLKDICSTVMRTLVWTDRYFDATVFHRYLREVPESASLTLVTLDPAKISRAADMTRYNEFLDISRLFASERGATRYRLVCHADFHDRWLRCDGQLYALGGSVKDAGQKSDFAIGRIDPTPQNIQKVENLVSAGQELFGPGNSNHP